MAMLTGFGAVRFLKSSSHANGNEPARSGGDECETGSVAQPRFETQDYRDEIRQ
jgi:hypothetical protein